MDYLSYNDRILYIDLNVTSIQEWRINVYTFRVLEIYFSQYPNTSPVEIIISLFRVCHTFVVLTKTRLVKLFAYLMRQDRLVF